MDVDIFDWWLLTRCNTRPFYIPHWRIDPAFLHPLTAFLWSPLSLLLIRERAAHTLRHPWSAGRHPSDGCWAALGPSWHPNLSTNERIWEITDVFCPWRLPEVIKHRFHGGQLWNTQDLNRKELSRRAALEHTGRERERAFTEGGCSGTHRTWMGKSQWLGCELVLPGFPSPTLGAPSLLARKTLEFVKSPWMPSLSFALYCGEAGDHIQVERLLLHAVLPLSHYQGSRAEAALLWRQLSLWRTRCTPDHWELDYVFPLLGMQWGTPTIKNHMWYDTAWHADTQQIHRGLPGIDREKAFRCFQLWANRHTYSIE